MVNDIPTLPMVPRWRLAIMSQSTQFFWVDTPVSRLKLTGVVKSSTRVDWLDGRDYKVGRLESTDSVATANLSRDTPEKSLVWFRTLSNLLTCLNPPSSFWAQNIGMLSSLIRRPLALTPSCRKRGEICHLTTNTISSSSDLLKFSPK